MTSYDTEFDTTELEEGDRIAPKLVASVPEQLGEPIQPNYPESDTEPPVTQLVNVAETHPMNDTTRALLIDPEAGVIARASALDSNQAWSQKEADFTVHAVGTGIDVTDGEIERAPDADQIPDETEHMAGWVEVVIGDMLHGSFDYSDRVRVNGDTLTMEDDHAPAKGHATYTLTDTREVA
jgi:hypothetical protein